MTATVTRADGLTPTGTVQLTDNGQPLGDPVTVGSDGTANLSPGALPLGANQIAASFTSVAQYADGSSSQAVAQAVDPLVTSVTVDSSPASPVAGGPVTLTATVVGHDAPSSGPGSESAAGLVAFSEGQTQLGTATVGSDGVARLTLPAVSRSAATWSAPLTRATPTMRRAAPTRPWSSSAAPTPPSHSRSEPLRPMVT